jgi:hypothetical protein
MRRLSNAAAQFGVGRQLSFTDAAAALKACDDDALNGRRSFSIGDIIGCYLDFRRSETRVAE